MDDSQKLLVTLLSWRTEQQMTLFERDANTQARSGKARRIVSADARYS